LVIGLALGAAIGRDVASFLWGVLVEVVTHPMTCFQILTACVVGISTLLTLDLACEKIAKYQHPSGGWFFITGMMSQIYVMFVALKACGGIALLQRVCIGVYNFALSKYVLAIITGMCAVYVIASLIGACIRFR